MKWLNLFIVFLVLGCSQQKEQLSIDEIEHIKSDIISRTKRHAQDLQNLDYKAIMTFYANIDDHVIFGDGYYWGDYKTVDGIWKDFSGGVKKVLKFDFYNPKIHVFSNNTASYLVEFDHERIEATGDTTKGHGCFSFAMQKIDGDWKAVTTHVTHNYNVFDSTGAVRKWWLNYSPENRINTQ